MSIKNFFTHLYRLENTNICLKDHTKEIENLEEKVRHFNSRIDILIKTIKTVSEYVDKINNAVTRLDHSTVELEQYTKILSGRIAKLKGKDNEKTDNPTG